MKNLSQNLRDFASTLSVPTKQSGLWAFVILGLFTFTAFSYKTEGSFFAKMLTKMKAEVAEVMMEADAISEQQAGQFMESASMMMSNIVDNGSLETVTNWSPPDVNGSTTYPDRDYGTHVNLFLNNVAGWDVATNTPEIRGGAGATHYTSKDGLYHGAVLYTERIGTGLTTVNGDAYDVEFYYADCALYSEPNNTFSLSGNEGVRVYIDGTLTHTFAAGNTPVVSGKSPGSWVKGTFSFTATSDSTNISFASASETTPGYVCVDNISVVEAAASCTDTNKYAANCDFDGDSINNEDDLDDDNDGILDTEEYATCSSPILLDGDLSSLTNWTATETATHNGAVIASEDCQFADAGDFLLAQNASVLSTTFEFNKIRANLAWNNGVGSGPSCSGSDDLVLLMSVNGTNYLKMTTHEGGTINQQIGVATVEGLNGATVDVSSITHGTYQNWTFTPVTITLPSPTIFEEVAFTLEDEDGNDDIAIDHVAIVTPAVGGSGTVLNCFQDTDNDNVYNHFDLDSDGDGCYDSYEAGVTGATADGSASDSLAIVTTDTTGVGANGFANNLESDDTNAATANYTPTYSQATDSSNNCPIPPTPVVNDTTIIPTNGGKPIGGTIFRDFQNDGVIGVDDQRWDPEELPSGMYVKAYDDTNTLIGSVPVNADGTWSMNPALPVRLELSSIPAPYQESFLGADNGSALTIANEPGNHYNFAINNPIDYSEINPRVLGGCLVGNGTAWSAGNTSDLAVSWDYNTRLASVDGRETHVGGSTPHSIDIRYGNTGHLWGSAFHRTSQKVFLSALAAPLWQPGALGTDGIYLADYSGANNTFVSVAPFVDLGTLGSPVDVSGDGTRFGEYGLGDITLSEDEQTLYAVNIGKKEVIVMPVGSAPTAPTAVSTITIDDPGCVSGNWRPYAITQYRGKLYVGGICDASTSTESNLFMYIRRYDPANPTGGWETVLERVIDWTQGSIHGDAYPWKKWSGSDAITQPQPVFVDLGFDIDGSIIIGLHARTRFHSTSNQPTGVFLRAHKNNDATYALEYEGVSGPYTTDAFNYPSYPGRSPGGIPSDGDLFFSNNCCQHGSVSSGGVEVVPGTGQILTGQADPVGVNTFGVVYHDALDGSGDYGHVMGNVKAALVTSLTVITDQPRPEIGNSVWQDTDADGIRDPSESGLANMTVNLLDNGGTQIATITTDANGNYSFNQQTNGDHLTPNTNYFIEIPTGQAGFTNYSLSPKDYASNAGTTDNHDSDASLTTSASGSGNVYQIQAQTGVLGQAKHNYDLGLYSCMESPVLANTVYRNTLPTTTADLSGVSPTNTQAGTVDFEWHSVANPLDNSTLIADVSALSHGTYYAVFYDNTNTCYSTGIEVFVKVCTDSNKYGDYCDFDGDGVDNIEDYDKDNDGIKDSDECEKVNILPSNVDGTFDDLSGSSTTWNNNASGSGFSQIETGDSWNPGGGTAEAAGTPASPQGGVFVGLGDWLGSVANNADGGEALYTTITGLTPNEPYTVSFSQSHIGHSSVSEGQEGQFKVELGSEVQLAPIMAFEGFGNQTWEIISLTFTPQNASEVLRIRPQSVGTHFEYLGIDGIIINAQSDMLCDTDDDNIPNIFDLDSDNDGCHDLAEGGAGAVGDSLVTQGSAYTKVGTNGLADNLEEVADCHVINYTLQPYFKDSLLNACADWDNDGVGDLVDIDDDNDGILDSEEDACSVPVNTTPSKPAIWWDMNTHALPGDVEENFATDYFANTTPTVIGSGLTVTNHTTTWSIADIDATSLAEAITNEEYLQFGFMTNGNVSSLVLQDWRTFANNAISNHVENAVIQISNDNFSTATTVFTGSAPTPTGAWEKLNTTAFTFAANTTYEIRFYVFDQTNTPARFDAFGLNFTCMSDADGDGIINSLDLDSDGDGCYDSYEAGVTGATNDGSATDSLAATTNAQVGNNGLANTLEDNDTDTAKVNYFSNYGLYALSDNLNVCADTDNDGIGDLVDIDDDNDGILDADESPDCFYNEVELGLLNTDDRTTTVIIASDLNLAATSRPLTNTLDASTSTYTDFQNTQSVVGVNILSLEFVSALELSAITLEYTSANSIFNSTNTAVNLTSIVVQGSNSGTSWTPLSVPKTVGRAAETGNINTFPITLNTGNYKYYRLTGVGATGNIYSSGRIGNISVTTNGFTQSDHTKPDCAADIDNDGIYNHADLDADGDGCFDAYEAGAVASSADSVVATTMLEVGANGLANAKESGIESDSLNYTPNINYAQSDFLNVCADTDDDGILDLVDIDDDNDGIRDSEESPSCYYSESEIDLISNITTELPIYQTNTIDRSFDKNATTFSAFLPNQVIAGVELFNISMTNPAAIASIDYTPRSWAFSQTTSTNKFKMQGYDGSSWVDLSADTSIAVTSGMASVLNTLAPNLEVTAVRIIGVSGNSWYSGVTEMSLSVNNFQAENFPKLTCQVDTDTNGVYNHLDLDSDGDGCSDAKESGATKDDTAGFSFPADTTSGDVNRNGLADVVEIGTTGQTNYKSSYRYAISAIDDGCLDTDDDGIADLIDVDDDNDGISDVKECFNLALNMTPSGYAYDLLQATFHGLVARTEDGYTANGQTYGPTGGTVLIPTPITRENGYEYSGDLLLATVGGTGGQTVLLTTTGFFAFGGQGQVVSTSFTSSTAVDSLEIGMPEGVEPEDIGMMVGTFQSLAILTRGGDVYTLSQVAGVYGDGTTTVDNEWHKAQTPTPIAVIRMVPGNVFAMDYFGDFYTWGTNSYLADGNAKANRTTPTKMDSPILPSDYTVQIALGGNGSLPAYYVLSSNGLIYSMGGNPGGVLGIGSSAEQRNWVTVRNPTNTGNLTDVVFISATDHDVIYPTASAIQADGRLLNWGTNNTGMLGTGNSPTLPKVPTGTELLNHVYVENGGHITPTAANGLYCNTGHNSGGGYGDGTTTSISAYQCNALVVPLTALRKLSNCDDDNDGLPNHLDPDSDNDGCPDAIEAGHGVTVFTPASVGDNGLVDSVETMAESGEINFDVPTFITLDSLVNLCDDYDMDGIGDFLDIDDDNDGIPDTEEHDCAIAAVGTDNISTGAKLATGSMIAGANAVAYTVNWTNLDGAFALETTDKGLHYIVQDASSNGDYTSHIRVLGNESGVNIGSIEWGPNLTESTNAGNQNAAQTIELNWKPGIIKATVIDPDNQLDIANGTLISAGQTIVQAADYVAATPPTWKIIFNTNLAKVDLEFRPRHTSTTGDLRNEGYSVVTNVCSPLDSDMDGQPNHLDIDSDNDGCFDLVESGAGMIGDSLQTGPFGANGLADTVEVIVDGGITNYESFYVTNALDSMTADCEDFDMDGVVDAVDIDDDNDGVLDVMESPSCFQSADSVKKVVAVSSEMLIEAAARPFTNAHDAVANTYTGLSPNKDGIGMSVYEVTPANPIAISSMDFTMNNLAFTTAAVTNTVKMQGYVSGAWEDLDTARTRTVVNAVESFTNLLHPNTVYEKFRITGVSGTVYYARVYEVNLSIKNFNPADYCDLSKDDIDNDGILNHLDRDSDGDGCPDAVEAGAINSTATSDSLVATTFAEVGLNGLANNLETSLDNDTINYNSTYKTAGISDFLNACADTDQDGVPDLADIDDDNDGIIDSDESPNCYYSASDVAIIDMTTTLTNYNTNAAYLFSEAYDGVLNNIGPYGALNTPITGETVYEVELNLAAPLSSMDIVYNYSVFNANSEFQWQGYDGTDWVALTDTLTETTNTNTTRNYVFDQNPGDYKKYRLQGISGTTYYNRIYEIIPYVGNFVGAKYPKVFCSADTDGDGIYNHLDLDSDGDGCYDMVEAGAGPIGDSLVIPFAQTTGVGDNGLADIVETNPESDSIAYVLQPYYQDSTQNACSDYDMDGVGDVIDIDDDNDGVLDEDEVACMTIGAGINESAPINGGGTGIHTANASYLLGTDSLHLDVVVLGHQSYWRVNDGFDGNTFDFVSYSTTLPTTETYTFDFPANNIVNGAIKWGPDQGNNNANTNATTNNTAATIGLTFPAGVNAVFYDPDNQTDVASGTPVNSGFTFSRLAGTPTTRTWYVAFTFSNFTNDFQLVVDYPAAPAWFGGGIDFSNLTACEELDTDMDGILNQFDRDSDGDGCPDAIEAGARTGSGLADSLVAQSFADVGFNGLADSLETSAESGVINYTSNYSTAALSDFINGCADTDMDGIPDMVDIDDDNDGVRDSEESPSCYLTQTDLGIESGDRTVIITASSEASFFNTTYVPKNGFDGATNTYLRYLNNTSIANKAIIQFELPVPVELSEVNLKHLNTNSIFNASNNTTTLPTAVKLQALAAGSWVDLTPLDTVDRISTGNQELFTVTQNQGKYSTYRIFATEGTTYSNGYVTEIELTIGNFRPEDYPKLTCGEDTDNDGVYNHLDLDSDNDGCYDLTESGAGAIGDSLTIPAGTTAGVGDNGLADALESSPESDSVIYISTYNFAIDSTNTDACKDNDMDGISDLIDIDDDNDGILDIEECENSTITMTLDVTASVNNMVVYTGSYKGIADTIRVYPPSSHPGLKGPNGLQQTNQVSISAVGAVELWDLTNTEGVLVFEATRAISELSFTNLSGFDNFPNSARDAFAFDQAGTWSTPNGANLAAYDVNTDELVTQNPAGNAPANMSAFTSSAFEFADRGAISPLFMNPTEGSGSTVNNADVKFVSDAPFTQIALLYEDVSQNGAREYVASNFTLTSFEVKIDDPCDTDGDGTPNYFDLDSDGDGCSDAAEAGHGQMVQADSTIVVNIADVGDNGLLNALETNVDSDTINYAIDSTGMNANFLDSLIRTACPTAEIIAENDNDTTTQGITVTIDILSNDSIALTEYDTSGIQLTTTSNGSATVNNDGTIEYTPVATFSGIDTVTYIVCDTFSAPNTTCDTAMVFVEVLPDNDGDGIDDIRDIDDDNDGILDEVECGLSAPSPGNVSQYANSLNIFTFPSTTGTLNNGDSVTSTISLPEGMVTATVKKTSGVTVESINTGPGRPAGVFFNIAANGTALHDGFRQQGEGGNYTLTYTFSEPIDVFFFDAENSGPGEVTTVNTDGGNWEILDSKNVSNVNLTGVGSQSVEFRPNSGATQGNYPIVLFVSRRTSSLTLSISQAGNGRSGIGVGAFKTLCLDTDDDGIQNSFDLDSDNDGIPDNVEAQTTFGYVAPTGTDTDMDGLDDAYDTDCIAVGNPAGCAAAGFAIIPVDTDTNSLEDLPDYLDLDSDDDGLFDIAESAWAAADTDGDGRTNNSVGNNGLDDNNESADTYDDENGNIDNPSAQRNQQSPATTEVDYRDNNTPPTITYAIDTTYVEGDTAIVMDVVSIDSTESELDSTLAYSLTGVDAALLEIDSLTGELTFVTSPRYGNPMDDGTNNTYEVGVIVCDIHNECDTQDVTIYILPDADLDGTPDALDIDDDNDGIPDLVESPSDPNTDADNDGIPAYLDDNDADNSVGNDDNAVQSAFDADGDGHPNHIDLDADNDGLADNIEGQTTAGYIAPTGTDTDMDGLDDAYDADCIAVGNPAGCAAAGMPINTPVDTDNDTTENLPDYLDLDSDNDGIFDIVEIGKGTLDTSDDGRTNGTVGINGLDNTLETVDTYADINGNILTTDTPADDLPNDANPNSAEVDYREVNAAPMAVDDTHTVDEDTPTVIDAQNNDSDPNMDMPLVTTIIGTSTQGVTPTVANGDSINYTPPANFTGLDTITYQICDTLTPALCDTAIIVVTVVPVNDKPVALNDSTTTNEDTPVIVDVQVNDSDIEDSTLVTTIITQPTDGSVVVINGDSINYTPDANFNGLDTLTYSICDNDSPTLCDTAMVVITIDPVNDKPVAVDDTETTDEDTPVVIDVQSNDSDVEDSTLVTTIIDDVNFGTTTILGNDSIQYTPMANYFGMDTLTYRICDNESPALCDTAEVIITINSVNDAPMADLDSLTFNEDEMVNIMVQTNDTDIDMDNITTTILDAPSNGTATVVTMDSIDYTPNANYNGQDTLRYQICDDGTPSLCDTTMVFLTIVPVNDKPVATDDTDSVNEDETVVIDVQINDTDTEDSTLVTTILTDVTNGTTTILGTDSIQYAPDTNFTGMDTLIYQICDNENPALCDTAGVIITVVPVNDKPVALNDSTTTNEDTPVIVDVQVNDSDIEDSTLVTTIITQPTDGSVVVINGDSINYTPDTNFNGLDTLTYSICDNENPALCDTAMVVITIDPVNDKPVAIDDADSVNEDETVVIDVQANDSDIEDSTLVTTIIDDVNYGTTTILGTDSIQYAPDANYTGMDTLTYQICDNENPALCDTAEVIITVIPVNDKPVALNDSTTTNEDTPVLVNVQANDSDIEDSTLVTTIITQPTDGSIVVINGDSINYTPDANFNGLDTLTYSICDNENPALCDTAMVVITIDPVNDKPVAVDDADSVNEDETVVIDVQANDSDIEDSTLITTIIDDVNYGTTTILGTDSIQYAPDANYTGMDTLTYQICDNENPALCDTAEVIITVIPVNDAPVANDDTANTDEDTDVVIDVQANDSDTEDSTLVTTIITDVSNGTTTILGTDSINYSPVLNFFGMDTLTYSICDNENPALCDTAEVIITVGPVNDMPMANMDEDTLDEDTNTIVMVQSDDTDIDMDNLTTLILDSTQNGTLSLLDMDSIMYTPNPDFYGNDTLMYQICDDGTPSLCDTTSVVFTIMPINDAPVAVLDRDTTDEDESVTITVQDNDSDIDPDVLTTTIVDTSARGGMVMVLNGDSISYTPPAGYHGSDTIVYQICDTPIAGSGPSYCDTAEVIVFVNNTLHEPNIVPNPLTISKDSTGMICVPVTDPNAGDTFTPTLCGANNGTPSIAMNGSNICMTYVPNAGFAGTDSVCVITCDQTGRCDTTTIPVTVVAPLPPAPDSVAPTTIITPITVPQDSTTDVCSPILDGNPGDTFTATLCGVENGTATPTVNGNSLCLSYTPDTGYAGDDQICVVVCDQTGRCDTISVPVTVIPTLEIPTTPQPPIAVVPPAVLPEDSTITTCGPIVDANFGDVHNATICQQPTNGTIAVAVNNTTHQLCVTVTPDADFVGRDSACIVVCDQAGLCDTVNMPITVVPSTVNLSVKVMLQGAMLGASDSLMRADLNTAGFLPLVQPYHDSISTRFTHVLGGNEVTTAAILSANTGTPDEIVDWVLIEIRDPQDSTTVIRTVSALVQRDGDVVAAQTGGDLILGGLPDNFFVTVKHRNHLGVMTGSPIEVNNEAAMIDFITSMPDDLFTKAGYDSLAMTTVLGKNALWAGNANTDAKTKYDGSATDRIIIANNILMDDNNQLDALNYKAKDYYMGDVNMDGVTKYDGANNDRLLIQFLIIKYPLNTNSLRNYNDMVEQLPE